MKWPLKALPEVLLPPHAGAFAAVRLHDIHTGSDLYCNKGDEVFAIEAGTVVRLVHFTGALTEPPSPWWNDTMAVMVAGESGTLLYGEIVPREGLAVGDKLAEGDIIGTITPVLKKDKGKPMNMLHFELYAHGFVEEPVWWLLNQPQPNGLLDPTELLLKARGHAG